MDGRKISITCALSLITAVNLTAISTWKHFIFPGVDTGVEKRKRSNNLRLVIDISVAPIFIG